MLPILCFIGLLAVDYARIVPVSMVIADAARQGALYASDPELAASTPYASVQEAALATAVGLEPPPTVATATGTDSLGNEYVEVTVSCTFRPVAGYPGIPDPVALSQTVRMPVTPE